MTDKRVEQAVKDKLWELWKKEAIRVEQYNNGWTKRSVSLGKGIMKNQGVTPIHEMMNAIEDFGIDLDELGSLNPNYDELHEIYTSINSYRTSIRFLKGLKNGMRRQSWNSKQK